MGNTVACSAKRKEPRR